MTFAPLDGFLAGVALLAFLERAWKHACVVHFFNRSQKSKDTSQKTPHRAFTCGQTPNTGRPLVDKRRTLSTQHPTPNTVSLLQPILSGDPTLSACLEHNLRNSCELKREFIWLVDEDDGEAQRVCDDLKARYTEHYIRIVCLPPPDDGLSPKMVKLIEGSRLASGEYICVLDDDTMLPEGGLETCLPYLQKSGVGLAFGLPYYVHFGNFWSALVACFVNSNSLLTYIPYTYLIAPFTINGMFYMVRRDVLDGVGGFAGLETALMDDFAVAQRFRQAGYVLAQTTVRHGISTHVEDMRHYMRLLQRWFIFPRETVMKALPLRELAVAYGLGLIATLFPLVWLAVMIFHPTWWTWGVGLAYMLYNFAIFTHFNRAYLRRATPWKWAWQIPATQLLLPLQLIIALLSPQRIVWRGHVMQIERGGTFRFVRRRASPPQP